MAGGEGSFARNNRLFVIAYLSFIVGTGTVYFTVTFSRCVYIINIEEKKEKPNPKQYIKMENMDEHNTYYWNHGSGSNMYDAVKGSTIHCIWRQQADTGCDTGAGKLPAACNYGYSGSILSERCRYSGRRSWNGRADFCRCGGDVASLEKEYTADCGTGDFMLHVSHSNCFGIKGW